MPRVCHLVPLALALVAGCRAGDGADRSEAGEIDGGAGVFDDVGRSDARGVDAPPAPPDDRTEADCFDFADDDGDLAPDCADPGCGVAAICCALGSDAPGCCGGGAFEPLELGACPAGPAAACLGTATSFGAMAVSLDADDACAPTEVPVALVPAVSPNADSGLLLPDVLDPRVSRITLRFTLGRAGAGLGRAAVGLVEDGSVGARVLPLVAVERTEGAVRLMVGEAEVARAGVDGCDVAVELEIQPSGSYRVSGGSLTSTGVLALPDRARVVIYGRQGDAARAWVSGVEVRRDVCTRIAPERSAAPVLMGAPSDAVVGRLSVARAVPEAFGRAVVELDGDILPATEIAGGIRVDGLSNPLVPVGSPAAGADWALGASDPQLVAVSGGFLLLFAGLDEDGSSAIFAQRFGPALDAPQPARAVLRSIDAVIGGGVTGIDAPAYFQDDAGRQFLFFRATLADRTELRFVEIDAPLDTALAESRDIDPTAGEALYADARPAPGVVRASGETTLSRDEIDAPRVIALGDGVIRIFYAGRRGTRWSVGALVTTDLRHFDDVADGEALLSGSGAGFDALGALHPEPVRVGPADRAELLLYYTGTSGLATALGLAEQAIYVGAAP